MQLFASNKEIHLFCTFIYFLVLGLRNLVPISAATIAAGHSEQIRMAISEGLYFFLLIPSTFIVVLVSILTAWIGWQLFINN